MSVGGDTVLILLSGPVSCHPEPGEIRERVGRRRLCLGGLALLTDRQAGEGVAGDQARERLYLVSRQRWDHRYTLIDPHTEFISGPSSLPCCPGRCLTGTVVERLLFGV